MVVEKFSDGSVLYDHELNNKLSFNDNLVIGKNGVLRIDVPIISSGDTPKVRLYLRGQVVGASPSSLTHGVVGHFHGSVQLNTVYNPSYVLSTTNTSGEWSSYQCRVDDGEGDYPYVIGMNSHSKSIPYNSVPKGVQIWIDGTNKTSTIGDPNMKGSTMYDNINNSWGVNGTTIWNTGELDLSSIISWSVGEHYIEIKETGGKGGVLSYILLIN